MFLLCTSYVHMQQQHVEYRRNLNYGELEDVVERPPPPAQTIDIRPNLQNYLQRNNKYLPGTSTYVHSHMVIDHG